MTYRHAGEVEALLADVVANVPLAHAAPDVGLERGGASEELDHRQGTDAVWTEGDVPATATRPTTARHLEFSVSIERLDYRAPAGRGAAVHDGELAVVFWYRLRAGSKRADARAAAALAADVYRTLVQTGAPGVDVRPGTAYRPGRLAGEWLPIELRFGVSFDLVLAG